MVSGGRPGAPCRLGGPGRPPRSQPRGARPGSPPASIDGRGPRPARPRTPRRPRGSTASPGGLGAPESGYSHRDDTSTGSTTRSSPRGRSLSRTSASRRFRSGRSRWWRAWTAMAAVSSDGTSSAENCSWLERSACASRTRLPKRPASRAPSPASAGSCRCRTPAGPRGGPGSARPPVLSRIRGRGSSRGRQRPGARPAAPGARPESGCPQGDSPPSDAPSPRPTRGQPPGTATSSGRSPARRSSPASGGRACAVVRSEALPRSSARVRAGGAQSTRLSRT